MSIRVNCPHCETAVSVPDDAEGRSVRCPVCQDRIRVPTAVHDRDQEFGAPEKARSAKSRKASRAKPVGAGAPVGVIVAMVCVGVLMVLNLWVLAGRDEPVWKLIAVLRLFVEARVLWGLKGKQDQTALTATVAAGMMTLASVYATYGLFTDQDARLEFTARELFATQTYWIVQTVAEIGVIVGVNLPRSKVFLSK